MVLRRDGRVNDYRVVDCSGFGRDVDGRFEGVADHRGSSFGGLCSSQYGFCIDGYGGLLSASLPCLFGASPRHHSIAFGGHASTSLQGMGSWFAAQGGRIGVGVGSIGVGG